jgi:sugar phosphate isomerase/epimerase
MQLGIFAKTFTRTGAYEVLSAVHETGFVCAQFNLACLGLPSMPDSIGADVPLAISRAANRTGVAIAAISGTYNMAHPDAAVRETGLRRLAEIIRTANAMGTRLVTLCTGSRDATDQWRYHPENSSREAWRDLCTEMERAVAIAEEHDIDLGIEPELANVIASADDARRLLGEIKSERLKIVLDPANLFERATDARRRQIIEAAIDRLADRIVMAHAKDRKSDGSFTAAGTGVIDFDHFVSTLYRSGFDGPLVTHGLGADEAPVVSAFLHGVLANCRGASL